MKIGSGTRLGFVSITWPHQVIVGSNCLIESGVVFKFDGIYETRGRIRLGNSVFVGSGTEFNIQGSIRVGDDTLIASGCRFVDHNHGITHTGLIREQRGTVAPIVIGSNVWIGVNAVVLEGVVIGDGSIIAAGAVVNRAVGENEIWGGVPARKIGSR